MSRRNSLTYWMKFDILNFVCYKNAPEWFNSYLVSVKLLVAPLVEYKKNSINKFGNFALPASVTATRLIIICDMWICMYFKILIKIFVVSHFYMRILILHKLWTEHSMCLIKANMNKCKLYETASRFFRTYILKGYWLGVCHGWFHLHGLTRASRNAKKARITKWKCLANNGIRTTNLKARLWSERAINYDTRSNT